MKLKKQQTPHLIIVDKKGRKSFQEFDSGWEMEIIDGEITFKNTNTIELTQISIQKGDSMFCGDRSGKLLKKVDLKIHHKFPRVTQIFEPGDFQFTMYND